MDPGTEASRAAIAAERRRSIRFVAWFRFLGISIAFALNEILPSLLHGARPFPFAFLLQWTVVLRNPAISAVPLAGTIFFMLLVLAAAFSLEAWRIVLAAAVGAAAEVWRGPHRGVHQGRRRAHPGVRGDAAPGGRRDRVRTRRAGAPPRAIAGGGGLRAPHRAALTHPLSDVEMVCARRREGDPR